MRIPPIIGAEPKPPVAAMLASLLLLSLASVSMTVMITVTAYASRNAGDLGSALALLTSSVGLVVVAYRSVVRPRRSFAQAATGILGTFAVLDFLTIGSVAQPAFRGDTGPLIVAAVLLFLTAALALGTWLWGRRLRDCESDAQRVGGSVGAWASTSLWRFSMTELLAGVVVLSLMFAGARYLSTEWTTSLEKAAVQRSW